MIENNFDFGETRVICDGAGCGEQLQVEGNGDEYDSTPSWDAVLAEMKDDGWTSRKENGEWHHYCPACRD